MGAAGVRGDVAAERAGELARRVWRIEEAMHRSGIGNGDIGDAGFDPRHAVRLVYRQHPRHARDAEHDGIFERQRAAGQRGAGAARHHLDLVVVAIAEDRAHLFGARRQHHGERHAAIGGERVGLEGAAALGIGDQGRIGRELPELPDDLVPAAKNRFIGFRQSEQRHRGSKGRVARLTALGFVALNYGDVSHGDRAPAICPEAQGTPQDSGGLSCRISSLHANLRLLLQFSRPPESKENSREVSILAQGRVEPCKDIR